MQYGINVTLTENEQTEFPLSWEDRKNLMDILVEEVQAIHLDIPVQGKYTDGTRTFKLTVRSLNTYESLT